MTNRRALLTDREREIIAGDADVEDSYRYQTISRVRSRFDRLEGDLEALEEHGELAEELREKICQEPSEPKPDEPSKETAEPAGGREDPPSPDPAKDPQASDESYLDGVDLPSGVDREAADEAIRAAAEYIHRESGATMREVVAEVMPNHPLGYDVDGALEKVKAGERFRGAWWRRVVKPGLEAHPDVESPPEGRSAWKHTGAGE